MAQTNNDDFTNSIEEFEQNPLNNNAVSDKILKKIINNPILVMGEIFLFFNVILYLMMFFRIANNPLELSLVILVPYIIAIFLFIQVKKTTISFFVNIYFIIVSSILILAILFFIGVFLQDYRGNDVSGAGYALIGFVVFSFGLTIFSLIFGILKGILTKINSNKLNR